MLLSGQWSCRVTNGSDRDYTLPASVPGCVHTDLLAAGILKDVYWRDNAASCQWVEMCDVTYTRRFTVADPSAYDAITFDGLDTYCTVTLNGTVIGASDDMFVPPECPVDGILRAGENVLTVAFRSPVREVAGLPARPAAFTCERLYTRRVQCSYGWDWVDRFVTMGIWKDVRLTEKRNNMLASVYMYTADVNPFAAQVRVIADYTRLTGDGQTDMTLSDPEGRPVWHKARRLLPTEKGASRTTLDEYVDVPAPRLWWPAGYGEQPLYTLTLTDGDGTAHVTRFGIRTVTILETVDPADSPEAALAAKIKQYDHLVEWDRNTESSAFILLVNGVRIFCRGANRVPGEPFPSAETPEKIRRLVALAREGGVNMLRVWGGGIFDHDEFYDACDEAGILVTQDFLMACGTYPEEDDGFIRKLSLEARAAALRLRNHPSLVWWSGDNENAIFGDENKPDYNGRRAALEGIGPVLRALDPARRFLPSSPYGGVPYASGVRGTTHNTQFLGNLFAWVRAGDFTQYRAYLEQYLARFTAEQPAIGMPYLSSLRKFLTDEDIFGDDTAMSEYHTKNNPGLGDITLYGYVDRMARGIFGEYRDGADRLKKMQLLHCEWIRLSMELFRRNMWFSSGIVYWMYNDCWPAANGWSFVDYYQNPKPGYYAFRRAAAPVVCSVTIEDDRYAAYVSNAGAAPAAGTVRLYRYGILTGSEDTLGEAAFTSPAGSAQTVLSVPAGGVTLDDTHILLCDLASDAGSDRAFFLPLRWGDMRWPDADPTVTYTPDAVTVTAPETIPVLLLDAPCLLDKNGMFLKRGETVVIPVTGKLL